MSTRANIKVITEDGDIKWLYKHHDGYPTHTGDILEFAFSHKSTLEALDYLTTFQHFENTTEQHGDINWLYIIKNHENGHTSIEIFEYHFKGENKVHDARFYTIDKSSEAWNDYKIYESKSALKEAKMRLEYYKNRSI